MLAWADFAENAAGGNPLHKLGYWRLRASQFGDNLLELRH
jgi:hypothetical protein